MSSSSIENLNIPKEEAKGSEEDEYDPINDGFLTTAFQNRNDAPEHLRLDEGVKDTRITLIIGESGSGKSTLAMYFEGSRLVAQFDGICWLFSGENESKAVIGNTTSSCTELPTRIIVKDDKSVYYDFPGFFDSRGTAKEIACSFYLKTIIDRTETFRIILTVDYYMFQCGRSRQFIELVDYLQGLFPNIDLLLKALFVVVTKIPSKESIQVTTVPEMGSIEAIQAKVREFMFESKGRNKVHSILTWLANASQSSRIEVFRQPSKPGEIDTTTLQNILTKLDNVLFIERQAIEPYVPKQTEYYIMKLVERLQNKMNDEILKIIQKIEEICQRKMQNSSFEELTEFIVSVKDRIIVKDRDYQETKDLTEFLSMLCFYAEAINNDHCSDPIKPLNLENLKETKDSILTLKEIMPTKEFNVTLWRQQFWALKDRILKIIHFDYIIEETEGILKIQGIAIKVKKLKPLLKEGLKSIEIYCAGAIFFEEANIYCKGANIAILAPLWRINGTNVLNISGKNGLPFLQREDHNFDGRPGNPGGNAGNFWGLWEKFVWNGELKIIAIGGKGGPGEDGLNEWDKSKNKIEAPSQRELKTEIKKPDPELKRHQRLRNNEKRGGKGGHGGCGGNPGRVIPLEMNNIPITIQKDQGQPGAHGRPGDKIKRRELPLPIDAVKNQKVPLYLRAFRVCCAPSNISDDPRPRLRSYSVDLGATTELSLDNSDELNIENLKQPSSNDFVFNDIILKETYNHYFNEVLKEGLQGIIGETSFINL